jgi:two-component system, cell cycle sensor histidine kinase and response regulator CckA
VTRRALETRRPVVVAEGLTDDAAASVVLADVRSVLCAPFFVRNRPAGCLYLTHHQIGGLFGEEDERVAEFIGSAAGAALETAEGLSDERRKVEERFRALIENSSDIVTVLTTDGTIRYQSPSVTRVLGYDQHELLGQRIFEYIDREDFPAVIDACTAGLSCPGTTHTAEFRFRHRDGSWKWLESVGHATRDETGELIGIVNSRDVSDRRTLAEQLRQSQRMEAIGQLAGGVAHDFNNILTIVTGHSELVLRKLASNPSVRRSVDVIWQAAERGAKLTHQLLAFSRKQLLQTKVLDLNESVKQIERMLRRLIGEHIALKSELAPDLGLVRADPGQIEQVIMNLALNARDAMPSGGRLIIETHWVDVKAGSSGLPAEVTPGEWVVLTVTDTGVGMAPETLARVFEPFFTTKDIGKGTGLGLATVYGIVKQSEGHIDVASTPGAGSRFRVFLPRLAQAALDTTEPQERRVVRGTETVLLVEDERDVRTIGREILEECGYTVLEATDGADALRVANAHAGTIDIVVTDVVMPELNGPELVTHLRRTRPATKVLYISGYTEDYLAGETALDRTHLLRKPFRGSVLARTVRDMLDHEAPVA